MTARAGRLDVVTIGGGIVGLAASYRLLQRRPGLQLAVLEKEPALAQHQSGRNSGVLHAGLYYRPGSLKARLCGEGKAAVERFAEDHGIAVERCGKLVIATGPEELPRLRALRERAETNGVPRLEELGPEGIRDVEPHAVGVGAVWSPTTAVVDFREVAAALAEEIRQGGGEVLTRRPVEAIERRRGELVVHTRAGAIRARVVLACAGLHADRIAAMAGLRDLPRIVPFRGTYFGLRPEARGLVRGLIYPVPDPALPFLGVHLTRRVDGEVWAGPNAVPAPGREAYGWRGASARDILGTFLFPGAWRMARRFWRSGVSEIRRELDPSAFLRSLRAYVPGLERRDLVPLPPGIRAQAVDRTGALLDDFHLIESPGMLHVLNAPSPAATASLAIGEVLAERAASLLDR